MLLALSSFLPSLTWTWIALLDVIDDFHLGLPHLHSYHHIPYVFCVKVQHALHILLIWLVMNPSNVVAWHAFLLFHFWCLSFPPRGGEKGNQDMRTHLC
jgi:hypothetical protein